MNHFKTFLSELDFLGDQIGLEHNQSTRFKSVVGGLYSLLIFIASSVIGVLFSYELFARNNPIVVLSREATSNSQINFGGFPIFIGTCLNNNR